MRKWFAPRGPNLDLHDLPCTAALHYPPHSTSVNVAMPLLPLLLPSMPDNGLYQHVLCAAAGSSRSSNSVAMKASPMLTIIHKLLWVRDRSLSRPPKQISWLDAFHGGGRAGPPAGFGSSALGGVHSLLGRAASLLHAWSSEVPWAKKVSRGGSTTSQGLFMHHLGGGSPIWPARVPCRP